MPATVSIKDDPLNLFEVSNGAVRLKRRPVGFAGVAPLTLEGTEAGKTPVVKSYQIPIAPAEDTTRPPLITTLRGGRPATVPQAYYDTAYADAAHPDSHPHFPAFTKVATRSGDWSDPNLWSPQGVPGDDAVVDIGAYTVRYDVFSNARIWGIHNSGGGRMTWSKTQDTRLVVYTLMLHGIGEIGDHLGPIPDSPVLGRSRVEILIWFPERPGRTTKGGCMFMGPSRIRGAHRTAMLTMANTAVGATTLQFSLPDLVQSGWREQDEILVQATSDGGRATTDPAYTGPTSFWSPVGTDILDTTMRQEVNNSAALTTSSGFRMSHDEPVRITNINWTTGVVTITPALQFAHVALTGALPDGTAINFPARVLSLSGSITIRTADSRDLAIWPTSINGGPNLADLQKRGHIMFMHPDFDVRDAVAENMCRTDTNPTLATPGGFTVTATQGGQVITDPDNVIGRYAWHFHMRRGDSFGLPMGVAKRCVAKGQPGPSLTAIPMPGNAFVHHGGRMSIEDCVAYNGRGALFVSEAGNEQGQWIRNHGAWARGDGYRYGKNTRAEIMQNHNGHYGVFMENQARQVLLQDNHYSSCNVGYSYMKYFAPQSQNATMKERTPNPDAMRYVDTLAWGSGNSTSANTDSYGDEQAQIPNFARNTGVGGISGIFVTHRQFTDRTDGTPAIFHSCHFWHKDFGFDNPEYSFKYSFYSCLMKDMRQAGFRLGNVSWSWTRVNCRIENAPVGTIDNGTGVNYEGFDVAVGGATAMYVNCPVQVARRVYQMTDADGTPTNNPLWNVMGPMEIVDPDSPTGGYTLYLRTWRVYQPNELPLAPAANLPTTVTTLPPPSVPGMERPYFAPNRTGEDLSITPGDGSITIRGTLVDGIGLRRLGDWMSSESWNAGKVAEPDPKRQNLNTRASGVQLVERNGCYLRNGSWFMALWFIDHDRLTGNLFTWNEEVALVNFEPAFLARHQVANAEATRPDLDLLPERTPLSTPPIVLPTDAPTLVSRTSATVRQGEALAHVLQCGNRSHPRFVLGGADAARFTVGPVLVDGLYRPVISFAAGVAPVPSGSTQDFAITVSVQDAWGNTSEPIPHAIRLLAASYVNAIEDTFDRADTNLEASSLWTLATGAAGSFAVRSNALASLAGGGVRYLAAQDMGTPNVRVLTAFTASSTNSILLRYEDASNYLSIRRTDGTGFIVAMRKDGTDTTLAVFPAPSSAPITFTVIANEMTFNFANTPKWPINAGGSLIVPADAPNGTRVGLMANEVRANWLSTLRFEAVR